MVVVRRRHQDIEVANRLAGAPQTPGNLGSDDARATPQGGQEGLSQYQGLGEVGPSFRPLQHADALEDVLLGFGLDPR